MKRLLWSSILLALVACGGSSSGSGVSGSKKLNELSTSDEDKLCAYVIDIEDAPRTVECDDGSTVTLDEESECDFSGVGPNCEATVDDFEGCAEAIAADPCEPDFNKCGAVFACVFAG